MGLDSDHFHRLLLYAKSGELLADELRLLPEPLADIGFIASSCHESDNDYLPGDRFMNLLTFLGCSPDIALTPQDGENYCFIRLHKTTPEPRLYQGSNTKPPHCRRCRQAKKDWQACEQQDYCAQCHLAERVENLVPSSQLLDLLSAISGVEWGYAYLHRD